MISERKPTEKEELLAYICDNICKFPELCRNSCKDQDDAEAYLETCCAMCKLDRMVGNIGVN